MWWTVRQRHWQTERRTKVMKARRSSLMWASLRRAAVVRGDWGFSAGFGDCRVGKGLSGAECVWGHAYSHTKTESRAAKDGKASLSFCHCPHHPVVLTYNNLQIEERGSDLALTWAHILEYRNGHFWARWACFSCCVVTCGRDWMDGQFVKGMMLHASCYLETEPPGRDMSRLKWRWVSHRVILKNWETDESLCVCLWPHCLSPWKFQSYWRDCRNQCELFIHGSNPQIYCHLICGYGSALMALMPSNRCPCLATQVSLHLVTPLSPGTRCTFPLLLRWQLLYENMHYGVTVHLKENGAKCLHQTFMTPQILFGFVIMALI